MIHKYELTEVYDSDHEWLVELHNDPEVLRNLTNPTPITLESHMRWWKKIQDSNSERRFIFRIDGHRAGFTKFYSIDLVNQNCVLGADLHKDFRGKGHAKHMWKLMLEYAFINLDLHRVSLTTARFNHIAQSVYFGLGFTEEGLLTFSLYRDGKFHDQLCLYMLKNTWENEISGTQTK